MIRFGLFFVFSCLNCAWDDCSDTTLQSLSPILTSFTNTVEHGNAEPGWLLLPRGHFFASNDVVESSDLTMRGNETRIRFWDDFRGRGGKKTGKLDGNVVGIETMFVFRNSSVCLWSLELDCGVEGVGTARVLGSCVVVSLCSIRSNMECSPFVVCWMGETDWNSITVTSSSHVSSCSPSLLPLVGICVDSIRSGKTGTASHGRLDRTDRTEGCTSSVSITGTSIELGDGDLILGTGPLIGSLDLDRAGNDVERKSVSTSLVGCVLVNMTSGWEWEGIEVGSWFGQSIVGSVVSSCSNHLYGTSIRSLNGGGSLLSLNSSFVSCLVDATNENKPFTTQTKLTAAHPLFSFRLCTFKGCKAPTGNGGGAISCSEINVSLSIDSCSFESCSASGVGGAIYFYFAVGPTDTVTLKSSSFTSCSAAGGASLRIYNPGTSTISECVFIESEAVYPGGAIYLSSWDPATNGGAISDCLFLNCQQTKATSSFGGGAMFLNGCPSVQFSSLLFDECSAANGRGHVIYVYSSPVPTFTSTTISNCASSSEYSSCLIIIDQTGQDFSDLLNQSPATITLTALTAEAEGTAADVEVTLDEAVSGTLLVVLSNVEGERVEVTDGIPNIGRVLEFSMSSTSIGSCSVSIGETGLLQTPLSDYSIVAAFLPDHVISLPTSPILKASCRLGNGTNHAWIQLTGVNIAPGTYTVTLVGMSGFSFDVTFSGATDENGRPLSEETPVRLFGEGSTLTFDSEYQIDTVINSTSQEPLNLTEMIITFTTPVATSRIIGMGKETLTLPQKDSVSVPLSGADMKDTKYLVEVSQSDVVLDAPLSAVFSANSGTLVGRVYSASGSGVPLEYGKTYGVVSVTNSVKDAVLFNPFSFTVPAEPARIKTIASTKLNREQTEVNVELTGVKFFDSSALFMELKNTNTDRAFSSSLTIKNAESCSVNFLTAQSEDDTHLQFGRDYLVTSIASVDGLSSFLFSEGLEVTVPSAPIVDTISSSLSPSCTTFQVSMTGSHLPLTGSFTATLSPTATMTVNFVDGVGTTPWLSDGVDGMQLNTTYTIMELANDNDVILVNEKTFTTTKGPTLISIDTPTLKSDNLNVIVLTLNGERMPLKATVSEFLLVVVEKDQSTEISIPVSFSTNWLGGGEAAAYPSSTLKYSTAYSVLRMTSTTVPVSIPSTVSFTTPASPTRIVSALGSLDSKSGKTGKISLSGIRFPQSKDFKIVVRELDGDSQPTGSPIELSSSFAAVGSSTSHTMTTPIFGESSAKLQFEKSYVITDLLISGMSTVVDSDVTFKVPAEPSRLISIGPMTYSNQDREVSVSLSGVKLSGTCWIVLEGNTSAPDVNVSVSFSESGIGELKGILYSKALPLSMNMTYDTVYKIVGMEDSYQKPIFFERGLTFETMKEPARIEDGKCQLNPVRDKVIVTLTGRVLSPGDYSVVLTHSEASKSRTITGSVNSEGNVECSHTVDSNEADSLVFGETYSISSAHRDGSPIHVTSGLTLQIPRPPKVTEAIVHPNTLNTTVTIELLGTGLDLEGNYSVVLVDGPSFTILFNADSTVTSPPLLIGLQDTLQFDTNYTLKSITNVKPEHDTVLLDNPVWFKTGVKPTNLTLHVDENTGSDELFCGETSSPCATVDIAWTIAISLLISKVEMKVKNSTTQSNSLFIPSNGFLVLSKYQLAGPTLRIPSAASMGERKGMIEVKEASLQISDVLVLIESVSDSFVFVFGNSSSVLLTGCSIVGSAQPSNSQQSPEDMCSWESGILQVVNSSTTIDTVKLTHLSQGAITMEGGHLSIEAGSFHDNTPSDTAFPSFRRNIHCSNAGHISIESLSSGDGSGEKHPHFWISQNDCSLSGEDAEPDTPLFIPTLSSDSKSTLDKMSKVFSIELSGSVLIPCGLWLEIVEITKSKADGNTAKLELTSETCKSLTENSISLELPPSLVKDLDSSLEWQGRLIFGNEVRSSTSFVIQKSSADKRSEVVRDNMKWWIPLVIILAVALLVFIIIVVILLRRRRQKKAAKSNEMTEVNTMVEDIKFEEETVDQTDRLHKSSFATPTEAMRQDLVFVETGKIGTNLASNHEKDDEDDKLEDFVMACGVDGNKTRAVNKNDTLFNRLHHPTPGMSVDKMAVQKQLVAALSSITAKGTHNFILLQLSPHQVFFDSAGVVCLSSKQRPHNKTTNTQPAPTQSGQDNAQLFPSRVLSDNRQHADQSTPKAEHEEDRWKAPETGEGKELDGGACAVFSLTFHHSTQDLRILEGKTSQKGVVSASALTNNGPGNQ
ncbi:hypothetical protein BLNAU_23154 [Blattamonas nauphoetae]|uniref:Uncharacterized protein n=1 Tax=Blattamonas nauphoetae TaxID=2049346 RepID=A0ABQ9WRH7_9EUKA|nr:hypothetical protein BLNAU_23154 [Blattamonas nauphoetae]